jgi:hypothetical protein
VAAVRAACRSPAESKLAGKLYRLALNGERMHQHVGPKVRAMAAAILEQLSSETPGEAQCQ